MPRVRSSFIVLGKVRMLLHSHVSQTLPISTPLKLDNKTSLLEQISDLRKLRYRELNFTKTVKLGEYRYKLRPNIRSLNYDLFIYFSYVNVRSSTNEYFYIKHQSWFQEKSHMSDLSWVKRVGPRTV